MDTIFHEYAPGTLIITTPNKEYNEVYEMDQEEMRHGDHRFEWSREAFAAWCSRWTEAYNYSVRLSGIGGFAQDYGYPTQMAIFTKEDTLL
ncbi:hypothetical protein D3C84_1078970 [compost metagenome]